MCIRDSDYPKDKTRILTDTVKVYKKILGLTEAFKWLIANIINSVKLTDKIFYFFTLKVMFAILVKLRLCIITHFQGLSLYPSTCTRHLGTSFFEVLLETMRIFLQL